jgi:hypothetical protein
MSNVGLAIFLLFWLGAWRLSAPYDAASAARDSAFERQVGKERHERARAEREAIRAAPGEAIRAFFSLIAALLRADTRKRAWRLFAAPFVDRRRRRIHEAVDTTGL